MILYKNFKKHRFSCEGNLNECSTKFAEYIKMNKVNKVQYEDENNIALVNGKYNKEKNESTFTFYVISKHEFSIFDLVYLIQEVGDTFKFKLCRAK